MVVAKVPFTTLLGQSLIFVNPPLIIIELVRSESIPRDYRYKRSAYAAIAMPEYWIVDPLKNQVCILTFQEGLYDEMIFTGEQLILSQQLSELKITPAQLLDVAV